MFSTGSSSSTSRATVTPSFTILGEPYLDSSTTLRPLGPSVTPTTLASLSTPACARWGWAGVKRGERQAWARAAHKPAKRGTQSRRTGAGSNEVGQCGVQVRR